MLTKRYLALASAILLSSVALAAVDGDQLIRCHATPERLAALVQNLVSGA